MRPDTTPIARLRLTAPPDLVTAIPALLGFYPTESLVAVSIGRDDGEFIRFTMRIDLPPDRDAAAAAHEVLDIDAVRESDELLFVVVGGGEPPGSDRDPPRAGLIAALVEECLAQGIPVRAAVWAAEIAKDAPWSCYRTRDAGRLPDPASAPLAAEMVASGKVIYPDRAEVERLVRPGHGPTLARRSELINTYLEQVEREGWELPYAGVEGLALIERWVAADDGEPPRLSDRDVLSLCLALSDPTVRDACLGFAFGDRADAAQRLWAALMRELPDPEVAEPAVLFAFSAVVLGDSALATVALERAQRAWPGHYLSGMFLDALCSGISPAALSGMFVQGIADAEKALRCTGARA
ncbi:DUF4192 domain-containing protein [Pseudonocardia spinosispora]|uniref:DUF4192 domain-containing protein n=1 Tax=Pseudonocardia spinosispora TaxID=103441 RepID=UPI000422BC44|nr:DUF4192 domain-containing protein [Pseudonocardia spinosispora]